MPLILCPNDNSSMTTVERAGVQFDMCPTCRGVWLDRGELEKLMEGERSVGARESDGRAHRDDSYRSDHHRDERDRGPYVKDGHRRRGSIFDIFD